MVIVSLSTGSSMGNQQPNFIFYKRKEVQRLSRKRVEYKRIRKRQHLNEMII